MGLVPDIDEQASRDKAKRKLKQYKTLSLMAHRPLVDIKSPVMDGMPSAPSVENRTESAVVKAITKTAEAQAELDRIEYTFATLTVQSQWILRFSFCMPERLGDWEIADRVGVATAKTVSRLRKQALLDFAEAYPQQVLIVFEESLGENL